VSSAVAYFALTLWLFGPRLFDASRIIGAPGGDQGQEVWFLGWPAYALAHGLNPFYSTWMNHPRGVNLMANTSMPLLGILGRP
jgi:hypothetical protein